MKLSSLIKLENINKIYKMGSNTQQVLYGIDLDISKGELIAIMGASGSGKSTVMNIIGLLDRPTSGICSVHGNAINDISDDDLAILRNKTIGFVFQQFYLLSKFTAEKNVSLPLLYRGISDKESSIRAKKILDRVGMGDRTHHKPNELSGGQQQRVAIARALIGDPEIILADEPTGALDSKTGKEVMELFLELNEKESRTVIIVTHDPGIGDMCDRIIRLQDGKVIQS
ncbi:MAG: ABC transporter ATP-binding protein [Legionellales bacterium]|nr:ABC transporter ATP-binding protein [Legionellales bacterium]